MFRLLKNAFRVKDIRSKILFTVFILFVFRVGAHITVPGVNAPALSEMMKDQNSPFIGMMNMVSGGSLQSLSIFAMGVSPGITASIVIQLLQMDIVPKLVEWGKQGEVGRKKINQVTRYLTLVLGFIQSMAVVAMFNQLSIAKNVVEKPSVSAYVLIGIILTAGTMFVTWMGEQITEKGFGNGVSMIIFAGIVAGIPSSVKGLYNDYFINVAPSEIWQSVLIVLAIALAVITIVTITTYVQQAERKIPIQYTKRVQGAPTSSYLPLKVNAAGVIPVIFASSLLSTPNTVLQMFRDKLSDAGWYKMVTDLFNYNTVQGCILYTVLIVLFTFFYAFVQVNPEKMAENLQKQGSYIPRVRPGKPTQDYVSGLLKRLSTVGSIFLGLIALLPIIASMLMDGSKSSLKGLGLGGTSLLIIIGVALEAEKQLEGLLLKRQYVGFINTDVDVKK